MHRALWLSWLVGCSTGAEAAPDLPAQHVPDGFWDHWGDGRAEVAGYRLKTPRYGEIRDGRATLVFVTEPFTDGQRVKSDGGHDDEYPVLKLNEIRDFQTGIYDYHVMTSTFLRLDGGAPIGEPVKVSMSMQEWCGHVYEQVLPAGKALRWTAHRYFDGEADRTRDLGRRPEGILLDALPILVRGLTGPLVLPGETVTTPALPTLMHGRMAHTAPTWTTVTVSRSEQPVTVDVPAGRFEVDVVRTAIRQGATTEWFVERAWPHRVVKWSSSEGEVAELLGVERLAYWQLHANGDERLLEKLGFPVPEPAW